MRSRLRKILGAINAIRLAVAEHFGRDEILALTGLALATVALWPAFERQALLLPGLVLVWVSLPPRVGFVIRERERPRKEQV